MRIIIGTIVGSILLIIGLIGLVIPLIPGILFLIVAGLVFATISPKIRNRLNENPRFKRLFTRLEHADNLRWYERIKLTLWATLEAITSPGR